MPRVRRLIASAAAAAGLLVLTGTASHTQDYPDRPIRVVIGFGAGASGDLATRAMLTRMSHTLGQKVIVENRPGAGSSVAAEYVARASNDGYTLYLGSNANVTNAIISPDLSFDFARDFTPIALIATLPNILVVHPSLGVSTVPELIALAKAKPGQLFYGSSGAGTAPHLAAELFNLMAGVNVVHVPFKSSAQVMQNLLGGHISLTFAPSSALMQFAKDSRLIALASTRPQRASVAPNLPTMSEAGLKGFDTSIWFGLVAPAGTSRSVIEKVNHSMNEALKSDEVLQVLRRLGMDPLGGTPEDFASYIDVETAKWRRVAKAAGLTK
jgi:tripartite-type tricarboxylate transporter receptor subunit TctC